MSDHLAFTENLNVRRFEALESPGSLHAMLPATDEDLARVRDARQTIRRILRHEDPRLIVIVGPCSIHDTEAALDYAHRLKALAGTLADRFFVVMRCYFEKPRTTLGWKGLINDPHLDGSFDIQAGLKIARAFMLQINRLGLPIATEALDPIVPQYFGDLVAWSAIGARTTESQTHREMASGLSAPVAFKNATDGDVEVAVNAIVSAAKPHSFLGIDGAGRSSIVRTSGNPDGHLVLRGSDSGPNYTPEYVAIAKAAMNRHALDPRIIVDCSHGNSGKRPELQPAVARSVMDQVRGGERALVGLMLESFIEPGNQSFVPDRKQLRYGCSITDACLGWDDTQTILRAL